MTDAPDQPHQRQPDNAQQARGGAQDGDPAPTDSGQSARGDEPEMMAQGDGNRLQRAARRWPNMPLGWMPAFLDELERSRSVAKAAMYAGCKRKQVYEAQHHDIFAEAWNEIAESWLDGIGANMVKLAEAGQSEDILDRDGNVRGTRIQQFPGLITWALERGRPEQWAKREQVDMRIEHEGGIEVVTPGLAQAAEVRKRAIEAQEAAEQDEQEAADAGS